MEFWRIFSLTASWRARYFNRACYPKFGEGHCDSMVEKYSDQKDHEPHLFKSAVTCGRIVFFAVGFVLMAIPLVLAYGGMEIRNPIEWLCILVGIVIVILGAILPPKIVANFGFNMPLFLPNDD
jgi:hypothetical protein